MIWGIAVEMISRSYSVKVSVSQAAVTAAGPVDGQSPSVVSCIFFAREHRVVITYECHEEH